MYDHFSHIIYLLLLLFSLLSIHSFLYTVTELSVVLLKLILSLFCVCRTAASS